MVSQTGSSRRSPPTRRIPESHSTQLQSQLDIRNPKSYELAIIKSQCVICGATDKLTIHHVVPQCIRKRFPVSEKARARQWCVLLCTKCHKNVEEVTQAVYKKDYPKSTVPIIEGDQILLRRLKGMGILHKLDPEKLARLLSSAGYKSISDIPSPPTNDENHSIPKLVSKFHRKLLTNWSHNFIASHGGIEGTKSYFRELFLDFKPMYLPIGYLRLVIHKYLCK